VRVAPNAKSDSSLIAARFPTVGSNGGIVVTCGASEKVPPPGAVPPSTATVSMVPPAGEKKSPSIAELVAAEKATFPLSVRPEMKWGNPNVSLEAGIGSPYVMIFWTALPACLRKNPWPCEDAPN